MNDILISLLAGAIGALIGTFFGTYFLARRQENKIDKVRNIAIKGLNIIKGYAKDNKTFSAANNEFNNKINIAEKRAILVAMHKLGIPIINTEKDTFNIKEIRFGNRTIDSIEINDIILQIEKGHCDNLFFLEVDSYFSSNIRTETIRSIAKRFIEEVLTNSKVDFNERKIIYPKNWFNNFTYGEKINTSVFREVTNNEEYFDENGSPIKEKLKEVSKEIDLGLWDNYLFWDYNAYASIVSQNKVNDMLIRQFSMSISPTIVNSQQANMQNENNTK